ncbi:MAG: 50S ribosomal protein L4 [Candidatus Doudnabacteria bacterium RIFCSPHIGHO2_02_FULL_48_21]|uniref:Large ribosomal subunit protein uL4 n=1 Tax=Candidatus Doudnabacteria bacterium RIFCSPLOWO2_02_FULL_48_13 TaxID=1817845 RepID=A0A1F5QC96_9BACT|nr:ribosomal protein L4 [uncultured bacterium]OGE76238.1 MAG: 50S ribosomal protein L4 [Candidatus Doudnabacteria bacterium RIFCSPHIGHO2_01_48_18]OGE77509.1 MAG: 50S ribosomal protein L4 [Candidatus Doudnabacteria bacterium RIFCSPHIGHO2_01_FULL_48_180]OGE91650.1 MAG: 50S ribosomal protein L4 [Candidatus Doudnabacteria bacterium RIFCSPHIGHO2_12_FULL_47_25]OGE93344.1 MAG: 50S ribosomal protein L4 [Candidatus Doudnabacteria bacterium RIFCSPHIGHO2_02_FULL_48_21]OGE97428.1 MAG: 50S ribosomal protei
MKTSVYNQSGQAVGEIELNQKVFGMKNIKPEVVHQVVTSMLSSARNVVASTKTKGEVRGGGKKPWQQKGTGRARAGSSRSPLWRGGGITFGPRSNRNFERKINKKEKTIGLFSVLSDKIKDGKLVVVDNLELSAPKTKELAAKLKDLQGKISGLGRKLTIVISDKQKALVRAGKNLPNVTILSASSLNILQLISSHGIIVMQDALPIIEKIYLRKK